jgi:hypothetical protein
VIVPLYRPATAEAGTAMAIVGSHVAELSPLPAVAVTTVCDAPSNVRLGTDVIVIVPVLETVPVVYVAAVAGMVCEPDVKSVEETVAAQLAVALARLSLTVTVPRAVGPIVVPGAPEPRLTLSGVVMVSAPFVTVNVAVVGPADSIAVLSARPDVAAAAGRAVAMTNAPPAAIRNSDLRMCSPIR